MDLCVLEYFAKVATTEQLSKSAEELNISQPALSSSIRRLETELGVQLFDRRGRGIYLNDYGELFLAYANSILNEMEQARQSLETLKTQKDNSVTFSMPPFTSFPGLVSKIKHDCPHVAFRNMQTDANSRVKLLLDGTIDFCVMGSKVSNMQGSAVDRVHLSDDEMVLLVPETHPLSAQSFVSLVQFKEEEFANLSRPCSIEGGDDVLTDLELYARKAGFTPKITYWCDHTFEVLEAIRSGTYIGLVVLRVLSSYNTEGLRILRLKDPRCTSSLHLYRLSNAPERKAVREVRNCIMDYFQHT